MAGVCDILCSDYLPSALVDAPLALAQAGVLGLADGVDLVSAQPATCLGLAAPAVEVGQPLTASLRRRTSDGTTSLGLALWRDGRLVFSRDGSWGAPEQGPWRSPQSSSKPDAKLVQRGSKGLPKRS